MNNIRIKTILFLILLFSFSFYPVQAQSLKNTDLTVDIKDKSVRDVFKTISKVSNYKFFYDEGIIDDAIRVNLNLSHVSLNTILKELEKKTGLKFMTNSNTITVSLGNTPMAKPASQKKLTGTVTDENGVPIIGASLTVKGTTNSTFTHENGEFSLSAASNATLVFAFLGYKTKEIAVGNKTYIIVTLTEDTKALDEVVVVGYGTTSKRKITSSISEINTDQIENLPASSIVNNLGGRSPGVIVSGNGGGPGNFSEISIRGGGTPIVVIDGVVSEYSDFQNINSNDVESINILKDAAAAAIYGSRAGNGILIVTTKQGANKPLTINYNYSYSLSQPTIMAKKLSSFEMATYENEAYKNDGLNEIYTPEVLEKYRTGSDPYNYPNTDWQALCLKNFAPEQNHNLSLSGGDKKNNYYASFGYYDQGTLYTYNSNWFKRYTGRLSFENNFENIGLKTTTSVNGTFTALRHPNSQLGSGYREEWGSIQAMSPMDIAYTDLGLYAISGQGGHPLVAIDPRSGYNLTKSQVINGQFNAEWSVPGVKGLKLKSISNERMEFYRGKSWKAIAPQYALGSTVPVTHNPSDLSMSYSQSFSFTQQFLADFEKKFKSDFTLGALFGYEFNTTTGNSMSASRENYQLAVDQFIAGPTDNMKNSGSESESGRAGYIGRLKADYKAKYMFEASIRHDGSDWFPKEKRWGTFYSLSGGWVVSDEMFMDYLKKNNIINLLKIRGSYGIVGLDGSSAGLSRFEYIPGYNLEERANVINGKDVQGFSEGNLVSTDITWYTSSSANIGFDFTSLDNALFGGFDYFYMRTSGYLASPSSTLYATTLGLSLPKIKTDGAHRRGGYEINIGYKNKVGELQYEVSANYTKFDELWENNPYQDENTLKTPAKRNTNELAFNRIGFHSLGYYTSEEDVLNSPHLAGSTNLRPGDIKYADMDGNGVIDDADKVRIGRSNIPRSTYGINLNLNYKGWFLYTLFQGSGKRDLYLGNVIRSQIIYPYQTDYWTPENPNSRFPRLSSSGTYNGSNNYQTSDFWLIDASYFRMKALQIGFDFKQKLLNKVRYITNAKLVLCGTNLFTISKTMNYCYDPETDLVSAAEPNQGNNYNYPYQRVYSLTLNLGF